MTPYELLRRTTPVQDATKAELLRLTRRLERAALHAPPPAVAATLQDQRYVTDRTREVHTLLVAAGSPAPARARPARLARARRRRGLARRGRPARRRVDGRPAGRDRELVEACGRLLGI